MKNEIAIQNFGPIRDAKVDLSNRFQIFIGAQASGKSTICKVVYYCQKIRDYTLDFLMDSEQFGNSHQNEYYNNYMKYLTGRFMGCFGKTTHMPKFQITYLCGKNKINIALNKDGYVRFSFCPALKEGIDKLLAETADFFNNKLNQSDFNSIIDRIDAIGMFKRQLKGMLLELFQNDADIIYIPAGRSLLATMSEQLHDLSISDMDLTMQEFISLIRLTKSKFGNKIPDMIKDYTKTVKGQINNSAVEQAYVLIKKILKADYTSENDGEKIYFDEYHWVKLMYGSSGQQEALWILMLIFVNILESRKTLFLIEEPEAHLFPIAQKDMVNLISLMVNSSESSVVLTTHSPYILTSLNILLYSGKVEKSMKGGNVVIPRSLRIAYDTFAAYKVETNPQGNSSLESLLDEDSHMISTGYIDEVSTITNEELDILLKMELGL